MRRWLAALVVLALIAAACTETGETTTSQGEVTSTTGPIDATTTTIVAPSPVAGLQPRSVGAFASFELIPLLLDDPPYPGPATPSSIEGIYMPPSAQFDLDPAAVDTLESQGFVVVPGSARLFYPVYQTFPYQGEVYFVTTDVAYHYMHLGFSKILRDLEQDQLLPILEELLTGLVSAAREQQAELAGTDLEDAADRVTQLYEAAATLLEIDVGPIGPLAQQEVELAQEASQLMRSPITGLCPADPEVSVSCLVDYSLFKPRGHYTRNADLERYFRAMALLGNENFVAGYDETMTLAALASRVLIADSDLLDLWTLLYEPTAFLVGMADDYTPSELAEQLDQLVPGWQDDPTFIDANVAGAAGAALVSMRPIGIDPEAASVRLMGARFVVDSYVYDQLRYPSVGDPPFGRRYSTPLDLVATFGSDLAYQIMGEENVPFYPSTDEGEAVYLIDPDTGEPWTHYETRMEDLVAMIAGRGTSDWANTVYDAWLYSLQPVWQPLGQAYPDFMRSAAWEAKDLQTGLGSYTELKHDTILYAKQSMAVEGDFQPLDYPEPRHWVEPNPVAFMRMALVLRLLEKGLTERGLLPSDSDNAGLIDALDGFIGRLAGLAADELAGDPISAADNDWLGGIGSVMEALWIRSADETEQTGEQGNFPNEDLNSALVADIMRTTFNILEIGTGHVDSLYVLVPDDGGRFQIAKGAVFSYYEFWRDAEVGRLTDQEWQALLDSDPPDRPAWQGTLFPGGATGTTGLPGGLACTDLISVNDRVGYEGVLAYWVANGRPGQLDGDGNGLPCDQQQSMYDPAVFAGLPDDSDLFCRDLNSMGYDFSEAVIYWVREGAPDRMDADLNGVPCETVYPAEEIASFFALGS